MQIHTWVSASVCVKYAYDMERKVVRIPYDDYIFRRQNYVLFNSLQMCVTVFKICTKILLIIV